MVVCPPVLVKSSVLRYLLVVVGVFMIGVNGICIYNIYEMNICGLNLSVSFSSFIVSFNMSQIVFVSGIVLVMIIKELLSGRRKNNLENWTNVCESGGEKCGDEIEIES